MSLLRTMSIARDSFDKHLSGYNSAMSVDAKLPIRACGKLGYGLDYTILRPAWLTDSTRSASGAQLVPW
jgi:hypothetical protein